MKLLQFKQNCIHNPLLCVCVSLSLFLSVCLSLFLSLSQIICLSLWLAVTLSLCVSIRPVDSGLSAGLMIKRFRDDSYRELETEVFSTVNGFHCALPSIIFLLSWCDWNNIKDVKSQTSFPSSLSWKIFKISLFTLTCKCPFVYIIFYCFKLSLPPRHCGWK